MSGEDLIYEFESGDSVIEERFSLSRERIISIAEESHSDREPDTYFKSVSSFILMVLDTYDWVREGGPLKDDIESLRKRNHMLYEDILPKNYENSYGNPTFAVANLGDELGPALSALYFELRAMIPAAFEENKFDIVIRMELFIEIYGLFESSMRDNRLPSFSEIKGIMYWFYSDYEEDEKAERFAAMVDPSESFMRDVILDSDLSDPKYLFRFGEYVTDNEIDIARHLASLSMEDIDRIASTFTEGYRIGFATTGKDITIKKTVSIVYQLGFERMVKRAIERFGDINLKTTIFRSVMSSFYMMGSSGRNASYGAVPNKQFDYDHKDDLGLFMDAALINRKAEALRAAGERYKKEAKVFGGPAVIEFFGEAPFSPEPKKEAIQLSAEQKKMISSYKIQASLIQNQYIIGSERSFTIISFPTPEIGDDFKEIFDETVKINTLDYKLYQNIQQKIIDALDDAEYVEIEGMGDNHTRMKVCLNELGDKSKETNFENCVADVNVPLGEVFTSPKLTGTEGVLHVTGVYLKGFYFKNLEIVFKDGCIAEYRCTNFDSDEENRKYISDNILYGNRTLPLGEFAIGTNTLAYVVARKYNIEDKLPILIAEKTGPHFAVGDTCYSHEEDNVSYNPDGKAIVARENEISAKRKTDPDQAYFGCHTDITIPYDELGEIRAVKPDGSFVPIIKNGRFVLAGTQELNEPLDNIKY